MKDINISLPIENLEYEEESAEYEACRFHLGGRAIVFRRAKITPTKIGQFVTLWRRDQKGHAIRPFDSSDPFDYVVVSVRRDVHCGYFVFSKATLIAQGIVSREQKGGKRAFRLYAPWDTPQSKQAQATQLWQRCSFHGGKADIGELIESKERAVRS